MASASVIGAHPGMPILSWLRACGLVIPGILLLQLELVRLWYAVGRHGTLSATVMNTISLLLLGGHALTSLEGGGPCLLGTFDYWGCWPSGFLINVKRIITKSGDRHQSSFGPGYSYPGKIQCKRRQRVCFIYKRISGGSRNGPGRELHRTIWEGPYSKVATGQKTLNTGRGPYLRGPADDVTLRQYGACNICWSFSDAVCVTAPATAVCIRKQWCQSRAL